MSNSPPLDVRFECQQSGHCCCDPQIIVTTTFLDIFQIFSQLDGDFEYLLKKLTFYRVETDLNLELRKRLVLTPVQTSDGKIIPGLMKINGLNCVFYSKPNCSIYNSRPRACRNYPIAFLGAEAEAPFIWAKDSKETCPGIGKGIPLSFPSVIQQGKITLEEINTHNDLVHELNIEASKGKPLSAREVVWMFIVYAEKYSSENNS